MSKLDMTKVEQRKKEYYKEFKELYNQIFYQKKTWKDLQDLRAKYYDIVPQYTVDTLRRGRILYEELMILGLIKDKEEANDIADTVIKNSSSITLNSNGTQTSDKIINFDPTKEGNADELLMVHGYNPKYFELVSAKSTKWNNGKEKNGDLITLYSSKITVSPKQIPEDKEYFKEILNELVNTYESPHKIDNSVYKKTDSKKCLVLSFNDLHWGRYNSKELDSNKKYDITNSNVIILNTAHEIVKKYKKNTNEVPFDSMVLLLGSDFFNSDCYGKTTLHRNPQDNCMNFKDMFSSGLKLAINLIDKVSNLATNVHVIIVPGNHGNNEDYVLGKCLEAWYRKDWKYYIDSSANSRKYYKFGRNLIGFTHGDKEKKNLANLMAIEKKEDWGATDTHVWITGHMHQTKETILEDNGVTIYSCPSLALDDEYTNSHGFSSEKKVMGFVFDRENGLEEVSYFKRGKWSF